MIHRFAATAALWCVSTAAAAFTFAALGDAPYYDHEEQTFVEMLEAMNQEPLAFAVHVGDFKSGASECSDDLYLQRKAWFDQSRHPFIFVPGDNDWTDCWRRTAGRHDPRERLEKLRELFFADARSLGRGHLSLTAQAATDPRHRYPEHLRWVHESALFATLNVPGGDNNFARDRAEFRGRDAAVRAWMAESFRLARSQKLAAVVLFMQANPWAAVGARRHGFAPFFETLVSETLAFPGEVVLIHGDTHRFRVDQPLLDPGTRRPIRNFTRIEVFGMPSVRWVRVHVKRLGGRLRFDATPGN